MPTIYITTRTILMDFLNYSLAHVFFSNFSVKSIGLNSDLETIFEISFESHIPEEDAYYIYTFEKPNFKNYISFVQPELEKIPF